MIRICVLGGGQAGVRAAAEAEKIGAHVTLLERSESPVPSKSQWPELVEFPEDSGSTYPPSQGIPGVDVVLGSPAMSVGPSCSVATREGTSRFDGVVIATGTKARFRPIPGFRKPGVYVLDRFSTYLALGRRRGSISRAVVGGRGIASVQVAEKLSGEGRRVTLLSSPATIVDGLSPEIDRILRQRAAEGGVSFVEARPEKIVGIDSVEAIVAGGRVIPCDAVALLPEEVPDIPPGSVVTGPRGGVLVDSSLSSSMKGCYAAGACAEMLIPGRSKTVLLSHSASASGRLAGANAAGHDFVFNSVGSLTAKVFGLLLVRAGLGLKEAGDLGLKAVETARSWGQASACSIVYDRLSGRVVGVQAVGAPAEYSSASLCFIVSQSLKLRTLAYADLGGSTDISLVAETARQGIN